MKKAPNKRWIIIISAVMVMVLATAGFAVSGFKHQFGKFHGKGFIKEHMLAKVDYTVQELKLTPDQQAKYAKIRARMSRNIDSIRQHHDEVRAKVDSEMGKAEPDVKAVAGIVKSEIRTMPDMITAQIDTLLEVYDILDVNQQKQLVAMIKEHMDDRDDRNCFGRGPARP